MNLELFNYYPLLFFVIIPVKKIATRQKDVVHLSSFCTIEFGKMSL